MAVRHCVNCGDPFEGRGDLCGDCTPTTERETAPLPPALRSGREPLPPPMSRSARCAHCTAEVTWDNVRRYERRPIPGHVEVVYYCPVCRSVLEFAAWVEIPPRKPTDSETRHR